MYERILPLREEEKKLGNAELAALARVWNERKSELVGTGEFKQFLQKLQREWAIETGIIERLYSWDRGVTEVLIEHGVDASLIARKGGLTREKADHVNDVIRDQLIIVEGLFSYVKGEQPLTAHFIRGLQAQFTAHQETTEAVNDHGHIVHVSMLRGEYKKLPNNPRRPDGDVHEYCPPELVQEEMDRLVDWYRNYEDQFSPEVVSAWLHHRFTHIHPFQDGNGRVARALASLVFLKEGMFPIVIRDAERSGYIGALEKADSGDLSPLVALFGKRQRDAILSAIGLEQQVQQQRFADEVISSAVSVLKDRFAAKSREIKAVYDVAGSLHDRAQKRLGELAEKLNNQLRDLTPPGHENYHANTKSAGNGEKNGHYFYAQIVKAAKQFDYYANLEAYRSWVRLAISTDEIFEFVVSFHGYGPGKKGIMVASAFTFQRVPTEEQGTEFVNVRPCAPDVFQFNYAESKESTEARFDDWLESASAIALSEWKRQLEG